MIRLTILFLFLIINGTNSLQAEETAFNANSMKMRSGFYDLWKDSRFGLSTDQSERAAWIVRTLEGAYEFRKWPTSLKLRKETWSGSLPQNMVALVHTHPISVDPRPSKFDESLAKRIHAPIYTISRDAIWSVAPDGKLTLQAGRGWFKDVQTLTGLANLQGE